MKKILFLLNICLTSISTPLVAQEKIPFTYLENKRVYVQLKVNDSDETLTFFFDTGAMSPMIDTETAKRLGIQATYEEEFSGASGSKIFQMAEGQKIVFNDKVVLDSVDFIIDDMTRLNEASGIHYDGIIGYDLMNAFVTEMDFDNRVFVIYDNISQVDLKDYKAQTFTFPNEITIPHVPLTITLPNQKTYSGTVLFDSGAGLGLLINTLFQKEHGLMDQFGKKVIGSTNDLTGKGQITVSTLSSIQFMEDTFGPNIITHISSDETGVGAMPGYLGLLGADIINRYNYVFDYKNMTLYAKPNQRFDEPFSKSFAPVALKNSQEGIVISHVVPNSHSEKQGVEVGDILISINGKEVKDIFEARTLFLQTGKKLHLTLKKADQKVVKKKVKIEDLL